MKLSRVMSVILIVLAVLAWTAFILAPKDKTKKELKQHLDSADDYLGRGLYQKAIEEYDEALKIEPENEHIWTDKLSAYDLLYAEDDSSNIYSKYVNESKKSIMAFPKSEKFHLVAAKLYLSHDDYKSAYRILSKAVDSGVVNDEILALHLKSKYAFELKWNKYSEVKDCINGVYEVLDYGKWVYVDEKGNKIKYPAFSFAGPVGEDNIRFVSELDNGRNYLIDNDKVIQGFFDNKPEEAGVYSENIIAVKCSDKYSYYDMLGDILFDAAEYDFAGTFYKGTAAVKQNGKWYIINKEGKKVSDEVYDDIILNADYTYLKKGVKSLKPEGDSKYSVFVNDKLIGSFDNVGSVSNDGLIAVRDGGKWGFINLKGEYVIAPQYANARSFSNGLAAVSDGDKWGFVDKKGELAIPYQFYDVGYFNKSGCCMVLTEQKSDEETKEIKNTWRVISLYNKI